LKTKTKKSQRKGPERISNRAKTQKSAQEKKTADCENNLISAKKRETKGGERSTRLKSLGGGKSE